jgi:hypothetical protein
LLVVPAVTGSPLSICGFGLRDGARERMLVANLTDQARTVHVSGLRPGAAAHLLGEPTGEEGRASQGGELQLRLAPDAVVGIESDTSTRA